MNIKPGDIVRRDQKLWLYPNNSIGIFIKSIYIHELLEAHCEIYWADSCKIECYPQTLFDDNWIEKL